MNLKAIGVDEVTENLAKTSQLLSNADEPMRQATSVVTYSAKQGAPVDTGRLRASIMPGVRHSGMNVTVGVVGSNVEYAPYMELGTRPHFPPVSALETWARRHGTIAFLVCRAIAKKGTKARMFLQKAFNANLSRINQIFQAYVRRITS